MLDPHRWVPLAEVTRPHGVRGELRLRPFHAESELLLSLRSLRLELPSGEAREVRVGSMRRASDALLATLVGVSDRDAAEALRGARVVVRRDAFPPAEPGEFYVCDIIGAAVSGPSGPFGSVVDYVSYPTVDALVVETAPGARCEVPLLDDFVVRVDAAAHAVELTEAGVAHAAS